MTVNDPRNKDRIVVNHNAERTRLLLAFPTHAVNHVLNQVVGNKVEHAFKNNKVARELATFEQTKKALENVVAQMEKTKAERAARNAPKPPTVRSDPKPPSPSSDKPRDPDHPPAGV